MFVILSLIIATDQSPQIGWFSWMPSLSSLFFRGTPVACQAGSALTQPPTVSNLTATAGGQQQTLDLQRQLTETRALYEGQLIATKNQLASERRENSELHQRIGALRQNTKECLAIVAASFNKTKSQDYVDGLLAGFMTRLSTEE